MLAHRVCGHGGGYVFVPVKRAKGLHSDTRKTGAHSAISMDAETCIAPISVRGPRHRKSQFLLSKDVPEHNISVVG